MFKYVQCQVIGNVTFVPPRLSKGVLSIRQPATVQKPYLLLGLRHYKIEHTGMNVKFGEELEG